MMSAPIIVSRIHFYQNRMATRRIVARAVAILAVVFLVSTSSTRAQINVLGGNQTLNVTTAVVGSEPTPVINTTSSLSYTQRLLYVSKVTVQTSCPGQLFPLKVLAISVSKGTAAPEVTLQSGMAATDLITNIPQAFLTSATATLRYTASPLFSQGTGTDTHTVTYTSTVQ